LKGKNMIDFTGQVALITGGSRGIGAATALMFAKAGADVAIVYSKDKKNANGIVKKIEALGKKGLAIKGQVEKHKDCLRVVSIVIKKFRRIDILVNNAGIWTFGEIGRMSTQEWHKTIAINLDGTFNMCNIVVPIMIRQHYGRIINVSSTAGQRGEPFHSHYAASKGGVIAFTKSIGPELIKKGIWVNCVAPGWVTTDMTARVLQNPKSKSEILHTIPRGKPASPEEIAGPIIFLASHLADNIVGEILNVNGGRVLCG
jgi:3-oxoacyl-[acyl-carrier protein] reductase